MGLFFTVCDPNPPCPFPRYRKSVRRAGKFNVIREWHDSSIEGFTSFLLWGDLGKLLGKSAERLGTSELRLKATVREVLAK